VQKPRGTRGVTTRRSRTWPCSNVGPMATPATRAPRHPPVVEVADTTLAYDRDIKMPLYARAESPKPGSWTWGRRHHRTADRAPTVSEISTVTRGLTLTPLLCRHHNRGRGHPRLVAPRPPPRACPERSEGGEG